MYKTCGNCINSMASLLRGRVLCRLQTTEPRIHRVSDKACEQWEPAPPEWGQEGE